MEIFRRKSIVFCTTFLFMCISLRFLLIIKAFNHSFEQVKDLELYFICPYASMLANVAFCSINSRRGPTFSPINTENV